MSGQRHELEIVIDRRGQVTVEVKGAKGRSCLEYVDLFEKNVGRVKRRKLTSEYYEPEPRATIVDSEKTRTRRGPSSS